MIVQHVVTLEIWRQRLLPSLLKLSVPQSSFPVYSVVFQEACCLSLLETAMFHVDVAQSLEDAGTDLLDYCVRNITHILYPINDDIKNYKTESADETFVLEELLTQVKEMRENIGLRCLSILRYMTDHISVLTLGVLARLVMDIHDDDDDVNLVVRFVTTHDTPGVVAAGIQSQPWDREHLGHRQVWRDGMWNNTTEGILHHLQHHS